MFFEIPIIDGVLDMDYEYLKEAIQISNIEAYVLVREGAEPRISWTAVTEEEWQAAQPEMPADTEPIKTTEEQLAEVKENQLILMDAVATIFESVSGGGA